MVTPAGETPTTPAGNVPATLDERPALLLPPREQPATADNHASAKTIAHSRGA
ncbi:Uncharacterised protein [Mycobacterium tuberculosis]|uniref:Uncharacterized protein n=1 Tax=Mycobacterium tuberculosis TaxID=1773 RepID=A0A655JIR9_MYCTX|nr:Uncharacterised protein [Mycobacterium tuberculosis]COW06435.1 Uncharacterised protein [Mycobacterium tuberculosis]COW99850.1 Uncharacterised protein [Mycobacterium tuberculosis]COY45595.1 Uncharacterised protein [Mycobacterium tuberculosis]